MIKLIAIDLDGTFLTSKKEVLDANRLAVHEALARNIEVLICTGRTLPGVARFIDQIFPPDYAPYLILQNGAAIHHQADHRLMWGQYQSKEAMAALMAHFFANKPQDLQLVAFDQDHLYLIEDQEASEIVIADAHTLATPITKVTQDFVLGHAAIFKMMVLGPKQALDAWSQTIPLEVKTVFDVVRSQPIIIEFLSPQTNKATALARLAETLSIEQTQVMAIGDEENDREMLEWAGLSVVMGNAKDDLKALADYVTTSNDQAGVANAIKTLVLSQE